MRRSNTPEAETNARSSLSGERLIRLHELLSITGESRTTCYENIAAGIHPAPLKDGRASLWKLSEVNSYLQAKIARLPRKLAA